MPKPSPSPCDLPPCEFSELDAHTGQTAEDAQDIDLEEEPACNAYGVPVRNVSFTLPHDQPRFLDALIGWLENRVDGVWQEDFLCCEAATHIPYPDELAYGVTHDIVDFFVDRRRDTTDQRATFDITIIRADRDSGDPAARDRHEEIIVGYPRHHTPDDGQRPKVIRWREVDR